MWRWKLRLSYAKDHHTSSNNITSGFERLTNGEFRYNNGSYESVLQDFTKVNIFDRLRIY